MRAWRAAPVLLLAPSLALAAGFGRPNQIGARTVGLGGGGAAIADDPTAVWHNPSGLAFPDETIVLLDLAVLSLDRRWDPPGRPTVSETTAPQPIPTGGASTRFAFGRERPARFALGVAAYLAYGGHLSLDPASVKDSMGPGATGITDTGITLFEVATALAYQVADVLSLGAALRVGIGNFSVTDTETTFSADRLSAVGAGIGGSFGATVRPHPRVQIGVIYRTPLRTRLTGGGAISVAGAAPVQRDDLSLELKWPQSAALGLSVRAARWLRLVVQGDWTGWSSMQSLDLRFTGSSSLSQSRPLAFSDSYTLHAGSELSFGRYALRLGCSLDTNAIPDATSRRETRDGLKEDVTAGLGVRLGRFRIDAAADVLFGAGPRVIAAAGPDAEAGSYRSTAVAFELAASAAF